jgi:DNA-binding transcriptional MerR regulator
MEQFTRREAIILTRTSSRCLAYLARTGIVVPTQCSEESSREVYYTWEQILELRAIRHLRRQVSLQRIRKIQRFLEGMGSDRTLHNKHWVISNGEINWIKADEHSPPLVIQVATKANRHVGQLQLMTLPALATLADEVWETARRSKVIDFESFRQRMLPSRLD